MDQEVLVREKLVSASEVLQQLRDHFPVEIAFMVALSGEENARLYIVISDLSQSEAVYREILRFAKRTNDPEFNPFLVDVVGADVPMAKAVLDFAAKHGARFPTYVNGRVLGQPGVDQVYIFASPLTPLNVGG